MFSLIASAAIAASPTPIRASTGARAFIRIERPAVVNADEWKHPSPDAKHRERIVTDERGQLQFQRVLEFE